MAAGHDEHVCAPKCDLDSKESILPSVSSLIVVKVEPPVAVNPAQAEGRMVGVKEMAEVTADGLQFLGLCDSHGRIWSPDAFRYIFVFSPHPPSAGQAASGARASLASSPVTHVLSRYRTSHDVIASPRAVVTFEIRL